MHRGARFAVAALAAGLSAGCATPPPEPPGDDLEPRGPVQWPAPPAPARYVYLKTLRSSADVDAGRPSDALRALVGGGVEQRVGFGKPYGVAARGGMIYVTDTVLRLVHAFDVPRRRYFQLGFRLEGRLVKPLGIDVDEAGLVYVADASARRVVVYDRLGLYQRSLGNADELQRPTDVAVTGDGSRVFVVDTGSPGTDGHRIVAYDHAGRRVASIGGPGRAPGRFNLPVAAAVSPDGRLYVLDAGNFRVQTLDLDGRPLAAWGGVGRGYGQFARPKDLTVDRWGRVYVADAVFGNVQVFDGGGRLLLAVGRIGRVDEPGRYALLVGVATDEAGHVYLVDPLFNKVEILAFRPGSPGSEP